MNKRRRGKFGPAAALPGPDKPFPGRDTGSAPRTWRVDGAADVRPPTSGPPRS